MIRGNKEKEAVKKLANQVAILRRTINPLTGRVLSYGEISGQLKLGSAQLAYYYYKTYCQRLKDCEINS
jgi:hypothetical protein